MLDGKGLEIPAGITDKAQKSATDVLRLHLPRYVIVQIHK